MEGHGSTFLGQKYKSAIWDRTPPHLKIKPSLYVCRSVQGSQIYKQNWIISICSRVTAVLLIWVFLALGGGAGGWRMSGVSSYSLYEFRNVQMWRIFKQNRIILISSRLIEFWCFGLPAALGMGGWVDGGGKWLGGAPTHVHMHVHTCTLKYAHACMVNMIISCKWLPPLGESLGIPYDIICMCACMCVHAHACACVWEAPSHHPPPPGADPSNQSKFKSTWTNQDISIYGDFSIHGWVYSLVGGWMDG